MAIFSMNVGMVRGAREISFSSRVTVVMVGTRENLKKWIIHKIMTELSLVPFIQFHKGVSL